MALVDRINEASIRRAHPVSLEEFGTIVAEVDGSSVATTTGVNVTTNAALKVTAYWSGLRFLSESVAGSPFHTYRRVDDRQRTRRANPPWRASPYPDGSWRRLVALWVLSMANRGNGFAWKVRNDLGQVIGLNPLVPSQVRYGLDPGTHTKVFRVRSGNREIPATTFEVLHIPGMSLDGYFGLDAIRYHAAGLGIAIAANDYAGAFYGNNSRVDGYISLPGKLAEGEAERTRRQWERLHKGLAHAHEFGVLGDGATYHTIGLDPEQSQLLESRKFSVGDVARMIRVPPHKLYDLDRATFSNIEHQAIEAVTDGVRPWAAYIEDAIVADPHLLPRGNFGEFNLEGLLRGDIATRYESYSKAINAGWMMVEEPRILENFEPAPELRYYVTPLAMERIGEAAPTDERLSLNDTVAALQKAYLAVDSIATKDEIRKLLASYGVELG